MRFTMDGFWLAPGELGVRQKGWGQVGRCGE